MLDVQAVEQIMLTSPVRSTQNTKNPYNNEFRNQTKPNSQGETEKD